MSDYKLKKDKRLFKLYIDRCRGACHFLDDKELGQLFRFIISHESHRREPSKYDEEEPIIEKDNSHLPVYVYDFREDLDRLYEDYITSCENISIGRRKQIAEQHKSDLSDLSDSSDLSDYKIREDKRGEERRGEDKSSREENTDTNIKGIMESTLSGIKEKGDIFDE